MIEWNNRNVCCVQAVCRFDPDRINYCQRCTQLWIGFTVITVTLLSSLFVLQADEDPIMGFHQSFILKNINDAWVCTNDMFRLALHNFG